MQQGHVLNHLGVRSSVLGGGCAVRVLEWSLGVMEEVVRRREVLDARPALLKVLFVAELRLFVLYIYICIYLIKEIHLARVRYEVELTVLEQQVCDVIRVR